MSGFEQFGDVGRTDPTRCSRDKDRHLRPQHVMSVADSWLPIVTVKVNTTMWSVGRWQPNSRGRLREAALVLYAQQGFPHATATEIATRADLTEPTFFAYVAGKRKVRFDSSAMLDASIVEGTAGAPDSDRTFDAVERGPSAAVDMLGEFRRDLSRQRHDVIPANPELRERERAKLAAYADGVAKVLQERGVCARRADLAAEAGMTLLRLALER